MTGLPDDLDMVSLSSPTPLLRIAGLASPFGGPFYLDVQAGECVSVMGASGSGKSVLLRLVADLDPGDGRVELQGRDRLGFSAPDWRRQVVYQAAEPGWWAPTFEQHLAPLERVEADALLPTLGLTAAVMTTDVTRLSTGERQRLALIRSMCRRPKVLLLDEPSASLDAASIVAMERLLTDHLATGLAIVLVTHSADQAIRLAQRRFVLQDHRLVAA